MGGPNLEIFKFGFYMFFPIYAMVKFGDPEWYESYVQPYKEILWPPYESTYQPPRTHDGVVEELARMKSERIAKAQNRLAARVNADADSAAAATGAGEDTSIIPTTATTTAESTPPTQSTPLASSTSVPAQSASAANGWSWPRSSPATTTNSNVERLV